MPRLLFYIGLMVLGYFLIKKITKALWGPSDTQQRDSASPPADAELIRDPQCGRYFMKRQGIKGVVDGKVIHFCSEECYDKFLVVRRKPD